MGEEFHVFGQCPVTVFSLNTDEVSIFDKVMSLQDAYNELLSDEVDDFEAFADAYLVLKGISADEDDLASMKEHRVLMMDPDADAFYLTKSIGDTQIQNMLQNVNDQIHKISASPDFNDDKFMAQSGIAMRYKLVGFENAASAIESNMKKALQRRLELISAIIGVTEGEEELWREAQITFTRNLPSDLTQTVQIVNQLRGIVSQETLLTLLPFVQDVGEEMERVKAEKEESMELYNFGSGEVDDDEGRDTETAEEE
jgi:SPP1 family phage portal protein